MPAQQIDDYLATLDEPKRSTLEDLRRNILEIIPDAEQCLSYGMPAFKVDGRPVAGFGAFKTHLSYLPHSGSVLAEISAAVSDYVTSKGSLQFAVDSPLPRALVAELIATRLRELESS